MESAILGKKTIIIDQFGVDLYPELIESGLAVSVVDKSSTELLKAILN
jgi:hypothetical protein